MRKQSLYILFINNFTTFLFLLEQRNESCSDFFVCQAVQVEVEGIIEGEEDIANSSDEPARLNLIPVLKIEEGDGADHCLGGGAHSVHQEGGNKKNTQTKFTKR